MHPVVIGVCSFVMGVKKEQAKQKKDADLHSEIELLRKKLLSFEEKQNVKMQTIKEEKDEIVKEIGDTIIKTPKSALKSSHDDKIENPKPIIKPVPIHIPQPPLRIKKSLLPRGIILNLN